MERTRHEEIVLAESNTYWVHALHLSLPLGISMGVIALGGVTPINQIPWYWLFVLLSLMFGAFFYSVFYFILMVGWVPVRLQKWLWASDGETETVERL